MSTSPEAKIGTDRQDFGNEAADISAVQNRTELLDLEDVSNFDRTALSESGYVDEDSRNYLQQSKNTSFAGDEKAENSKVPSPSTAHLYSVNEKKNGGGEWKVAGKSIASPPSKPPRQIKSPDYVSSDTNNNSNTSESIISAYQDRMDNTATDVSISKYNDYLGENDSAIAPSDAIAAPSNNASAVTASPTATTGLFTNIYETKGSPMPSPEAASPSLVAPPAEKEATEQLRSRIRVLEAEARVRAKERMEFDEEVQKMEVNWSTELTALSIRNKSLEEENRNLREHQRKANIEMSRLVGQLASLEVAKENAELRVGNSKGQADREAMGTVLAQQKLLRLLEEQSISAEANAGLLREESDAVKKMHKEAAEQLVEWKSRALAAEKALEVMGGGSGEDRKAMEEDQAGAKGTDVTAKRPVPLLSVENATRAVLNTEMEKYLSLERSKAIPVLARADNNAHAWQFQPRESTFTNYFSVADTNEELFSKSKVTPSVQSTSTINRLQRYGKL